MEIQNRNRSYLVIKLIQTENRGLMLTSNPRQKMKVKLKNVMTVKSQINRMGDQTINQLTLSNNERIFIFPFQTIKITVWCTGVSN